MKTSDFTKNELKIIYSALHIVWHTVILPDRWVQPIKSARQKIESALDMKEA